MNHQDRFSLVLSGVLGLALAVLSLPLKAAPPPPGHPSVKPEKVTGVPTCRGTGKIGNMIFTKRPTDAGQKEYSGVIHELEISDRNVPQFFGRRFYTCTLREAVDHIKKQRPTASTFKLQTNVKVYDPNKNLKRDKTTSMTIERSMLGPSWNTTHFTGKPIGLLMSSLAPGEYVLYVDTHVTYNYVKDKVTNRRVPSNVLLAGGKLPVTVK